MSILSHFLKYITANVLIVVLGLESLIYGYLKLTILFVKMLFSKDTAGRSEAGKVSNLVLACYSCNRGKGKLMIDEDHQGTLNPDDGSIAQVFDRNEDYYICIRPDYAEDQVVVDFYQKLLLGSEFRRLDYLLLEIKNFISTQRTSNPTVAEKLEQCLGALIMKRNKTLI